MSDYPDNVHRDLIDLYESDLLFGKQKDIAEKLIFDERMRFSWGAFSKRINECGRPFFFLHGMILSIEDFLTGPSAWDLLTQKEKEEKVNRISKLSSQLADEIMGTPLDVNVTEYFNHKFYLEWFKEHNKDEMAISRMNYFLDKFCKIDDAYYKKGDGLDLGVASAWHAVGVNGPNMSGIFTDLHTNAVKFKSVSIIKRKANPNKSFFVRKLSAFFEASFNLKLYELTAAISSVFLDEDISREEVTSMTR
ncbi:TPA: hypothetical protein ACJCW2_001174 [Yersinia enterocolitica]